MLLAKKIFEFHAQVQKCHFGNFSILPKWHFWNRAWNSRAKGCVTEDLMLRVTLPVKRRGETFQIVRTEKGFAQQQFVAVYLSKITFVSLAGKRSWSVSLSQSCILERIYLYHCRNDKLSLKPRCTRPSQNNLATPSMVQTVAQCLASYFRDQGK